MAQSHVIPVSRGVAQKPIVDMNAEEVMGAVDEFMAQDESREIKVRVNVLGHVATLYSGGNPVAVGRGRGAVNALAAALETLK